MLSDSQERRLSAEYINGYLGAVGDLNTPGDDASVILFEPVDFSQEHGSEITEDWKEWVSLSANRFFSRNYLERERRAPDRQSDPTLLGPDEKVPFYLYDPQGTFVKWFLHRLDAFFNGHFQTLQCYLTEDTKGEFLYSEIFLFHAYLNKDHPAELYRLVFGIND